MKRYFFPALSLIGFIVLLGAAGGSECDMLTIGQAAARGIIGLLLFGAGTLGTMKKEKAAAITSSNRPQDGKTSTGSQAKYTTTGAKAQCERRA